MATRKKNKKSPRKGLLIFALLFIAISLFLLYKVFGPNTGSFSNGEYLYIHTGATYETVKQTLEQDGFIKNMTSFNIVAERADYPDHIHPGKYHIKPGMSNFAIVRLLRSGRQTPVKLVINKLRTRQDFITLLSSNLEADST